MDCVFDLVIVESSLFHDLVEITPPIKQELIADMSKPRRELDFLSINNLSSLS